MLADSTLMGAQSERLFMCDNDTRFTIYEVHTFSRAFHTKMLFSSGARRISDSAKGLLDNSLNSCSENYTNISVADPKLQKQSIIHIPTHLEQPRAGRHRVATSSPDRARPYLVPLKKDCKITDCAYSGWRTKQGNAVAV